MKIYQGYQFRRAVEEAAQKVCKTLGLGKVRIYWTTKTTTAGINYGGDLCLADIADDARLNEADLHKYMGFVVHELCHRAYTDFDVFCSTQNEYVQQLHNAVEDAFIEHKAIAKGVTYRFVLTDANDVQIGEYDDIAGVNDISTESVAWATITGTPTTVAGYGITDALTTTAAAATYAPIASPTFTGTPLIPDNGSPNTNYAVGYREAPQNSQTANYTLALSDRGKSVVMNGTSIKLFIPANTSVNFPVGTVVIIINLNATSLSIEPITDTLTLANSVTTGNRTLARNGMATCVKIGSTSWLISGAGLS